MKGGTNLSFHLSLLLDRITIGATTSASDFGGTSRSDGPRSAKKVFRGQRKERLGQLRLSNGIKNVCASYARTQRGTVQHSYNRSRVLERMHR